MKSAVPDKIELLAPAKNLACGIAAINHGADAVYVGGPGFSARAAAANSVEDIGKLARYAHLFGAKVYVALNTLFTDQELPVVLELCHQLYQVDVDALIIQDTGLLMLDLPPIELHSSTQMNNRSVEQVRFWEDVGFTQVVLARELSLEQIRAIRSKTSVVLECFVHGALCVSYSGQCYISEVMAGRSANRGECAQFCRHRYDLKNEKGKLLAQDRYLLSLQDLDLSAHLGALIDAGVRSFKIEGRLKDENYVKNVTAHYRLALDTIIDRDARLKRSSSGTCRFDFEPDPTRSFSRGKTSYFLQKKRNAAAEIRTPKSVGKLLGRVIGVEKGAIRIETAEVIHNGDGLCYYDSHEVLVGIRINKVVGKLLYPKDGVTKLRPPTGTNMYRNADTAFAKTLSQSENCRSIGVQLHLTETDIGLQLIVSDGDGVSSQVTLAVAGEEAKSPEAVNSTALRQLQKTGGTAYRVEAVQIQLQKGLFYPAALFNELRRAGLAEHTKKRIAHFKAKPAPARKDSAFWPDRELSYLDNIMNSKAEHFYLSHGVKSLDRGRLRIQNVEDVQLMTTKYCVKAQLNSCPKMHTSKMPLHDERLYLSDQISEYELRFDCEKCEMQIRLKK